MSAVTRAADLAAAVTATGSPAVVGTHNPREVTSLAMAGVAVLVGMPRWTFDRRPPGASVVFDIFVVAAHEDPLVAWERLDGALVVLHAALGGLDTAEPVTWALGDGGPAALAYRVTYPDIL